MNNLPQYSLKNDHEKNHFDSPIFVLGLPRSGTSLVAGALKICGAWLGDTVPGGGEENPKGFFENIYLREQINKKILGALQVDPLGVQSLPELNSLPPVEGLEELIKKGLLEDGYDFTQPWLFKDAKLTLLWPLYLKVFPKAHWVIVRREDEHIISSCLNTSFMKKQSIDPKFWKKWIDEYLTRLDALKQSNCTCSEIWAPSIIDGDLTELKKICHTLGLTWDNNALKEFVTPTYWHFK